MIDISKKYRTLRIATAEGFIRLGPLARKQAELGISPKGHLLETAKVAATMAIKNTPQIIPYCHPIAIEGTKIQIENESEGIRITVEVTSIGKTGVEMEALSAVSIACLTLYDMLKYLDEPMTIEKVQLVSKKGGKSDYHDYPVERIKAGVLVISDRVSSGTYEDKSGKAIVEMLNKYQVTIQEFDVVPDEPALIQEKVKLYCDEKNINLIITTGGTGFSERDFTPEAIEPLIERKIPGISEYIRSYGQERTPYSMLSRGIAGLRKQCLIITLPGSSRGVRESLDALFPGVLHGFKIMKGGNH